MIYKTGLKKRRDRTHVQIVESVHELHNFIAMRSLQTRILQKVGHVEKRMG